MPSTYRYALRMTLALTAVAAAGSLVLPSSADAKARRPPPTASRTSRAVVASLQREVNVLAARYAKARAGYERLGDQVDALEKELRGLRAQILPVRESATRRMVSIYEAGGRRTLPNLSPGRGLDAERKQHLASALSSRDRDSLRALDAAAARVAARRDELAARHQEEQAALMRFEEESRRIRGRLDELGRAQKRLQTEAAERDRSRRVSRSGAAAPSVPVGIGGEFICPLLGPVAFTDDWGDPRSGGRRHQGTDMLAPRGAENVAVVAGSVTFKRSGAGGLAAYLMGDDGNEYFYAHLDSSVGSPRRVPQGEVIGLTGNTGNARGGPTHTHFEIHPGKGRPVNPYPVLRQYC
ncbi:MAG: murein hydrolase activator EnvC family protein [Acidimicrobiia bacterium]